MTVQTNTSVADFNGNGVTQIFPVAFKFNNAADLVVLLIDDESGAATPLTLNSDYTVSGEGDDEGGQINLVVAPTSVQRLKVSRIVEILQKTDLRNQGKYFAEVHEDVFDRLTMIAQQHDAGIRSSIRVAESDPQPAPLPPAASRANKVMGFDENGDPVATLPGSGTATELALDLLGEGGANLVGRGESTVGEDLSLIEQRITVLPSPIDAPYGAKGDGVTNDSAAFTALESVVAGRTIDLLGKTYLVTSTPAKNAYVNGAFKIGSATYPAVVFNSYLAGVPKYARYGSQLRNLKEALGDPLVQFVGIVAVGDSITWGRTLPDNGSVTPQTQLLTTARDNASTPSFWNNLRRYIGGQYMKGATLTISNWAASPSGQAIATYVRPVMVYPKDGPFTLSAVGSNQTNSSAARATSPTGFMYTLADGAPGGSNYQQISFNFTGDTFTLVFRATNTGDFNNYDLIVDGVTVGTYTTQDGVDSVVSGDNNRRVHTFGYVRNKVVTIRTNSTGLAGVRRLYLEGIEIPKTVRFTNQGVIGQTARTYDLYNLSGSYSSPTAVTGLDQFIFCQFGTNDRGDTDVPPGPGEFERSMQAILNRLMPLGDVILMVAGPVADSIEPPAPSYMTMQDVRGVLSKVAKTNSLAFIDNFAAFESINPSAILDGNTHPNALGHAIMSRNIINALES